MSHSNVYYHLNFKVSDKVREEKAQKNPVLSKLRDLIIYFLSKAISSLEWICLMSLNP